MDRKIVIYDTTLRDGAQAEGVDFSVENKIAVARRLDEFGVGYIEGGWPADKNLKDIEFFRRASELIWKHARIAAFGSTCKVGQSAEKDQNLQALLKARTEVITIFGKAWDFQVTHALHATLEENLRMIRDSVSFLKSRVAEVIYDAEHFFDGFRSDPQYALITLRMALEGGAETLVLCDTNGGTLTPDLIETIKTVRKSFPKANLGIHVHNDGELAVANTLAAVVLGISHVQGTINGYGERCGNANLCSIIPNLQLKMGLGCVPSESLSKIKDLSGFVAETANVQPWKHQPYVGSSAFAHKGGTHASAVLRHPDTYEHVKPEVVGNHRRFLASDQAGRSSVLQKAREFGIEVGSSDPNVEKIIAKLKALENDGFQFESAEASFEILMRKVLGHHRPFFQIKSVRTIVEKRKEGEDSISEATVKVVVGGKTELTVAEGTGPVNALDGALRKALSKAFPELKEMALVDYKVRVLTARKGTAVPVRVLIESASNGSRWGTVGVSTNLIEASWQALLDSYEFYLFKKEEEKKTRH